MRYWHRHSNWGSNYVKDCSLLVLMWTNTAPRWIWGDYVSSTIADLPEGAGNHFIQLNQLQCCNLLLCSGIGAGYWVQVNHSRIRSKKLFSMSPLAMILLFLKQLLSLRLMKVVENHFRISYCSSKAPPEAARSWLGPISFATRYLAARVHNIVVHERAWLRRCLAFNLRSMARNLWHCSGQGFYFSAAHICGVAALTQEKNESREGWEDIYKGVYWVLLTFSLYSVIYSRPPNYEPS
jgi:hypothetical protein